MDYNKNNIHVAVSYLEDTAVCLATVNLPHEINQSIGRVLDYIVPIISKSEKTVRGSSCNYRVESMLESAIVVRDREVILI